MRESERESDGGGGGLTRRNMLAEQTSNWTNADAGEEKLHNQTDLVNFRTENVEQKLMLIGGEPHMGRH